MVSSGRAGQVAGRRHERALPRANASSTGVASQLSGGLQLITALGPPVTLITALLFYFGWARSAVQARELGIEESVLDMSTRDYLLRSVSSLWIPLGTAAAAGLAWLWVHERVMVRVAKGPPFDTVMTMARVLSWTWLIAAALAAMSAIVSPDGGEIVAPLVLAAGLLATAYGVRLKRLLTASMPGAAPATRPTTLHGALQVVLAGALLALILFWAVENYASAVGRGLADRIAENVTGLVAVTIYSPARLQLDAPGVTETALSGDPSAYHFRYSGLRLLQKSGGKYFLLTDGWSRDHGAIVVLQESPTLRMEFANNP